MTQRPEDTRVAPAPDASERSRDELLEPHIDGLPITTTEPDDPQVDVWSERSFRPIPYTDARAFLEALTTYKPLDAWSYAKVPERAKRPMSYADSVARGVPSWTSRPLPLDRSNGLRPNGGRIKWSRDGLMDALREATRELGPGKSLSSHDYRRLERARGWPRATALPKLARRLGTTAQEMRATAMREVHGSDRVRGQGVRIDRTPPSSSDEAEDHGLRSPPPSTIARLPRRRRT